MISKILDSTSNLMLFIFLLVMIVVWAESEMIFQDHKEIKEQLQTIQRTIESSSLTTQSEYARLIK
jgi:hypothetical protein